MLKSTKQRTHKVKSYVDYVKPNNWSLYYIRISSIKLTIVRLHLCFFTDNELMINSVINDWLMIDWWSMLIMSRWAVKTLFLSREYQQLIFGEQFIPQWWTINGNFKKNILKQSKLAYDQRPRLRLNSEALVRNVLINFRTAFVFLGWHEF